MWVPLGRHCAPESVQGPLPSSLYALQTSRLCSSQTPLGLSQCCSLNVEKLPSALRSRCKGAFLLTLTS